MGIRRDGWRCVNGVAAGLDVSLAAAAGAVVSGAYFGDKISPLSDSTNFAAIVADTTLFEHIQHLLWTTLPSFLLAAVVYLIAGHSNMLGEVATPQRVTDIIHSLESLYHFNIVLILPPVIVLWGAIRKKACHPINVKRLRTCLVPRRHHAGTEHQTGTGRFH